MLLVPPLVGLSFLLIISLFQTSCRRPPWRWCWLPDVPGVFQCAGEEAQLAQWGGLQWCWDEPLYFVFVRFQIGFQVLILPSSVAHAFSPADRRTRRTSHRASVLVVHLSLTSQNSDVFLWVDCTEYISMTDGVCPLCCTPPSPHSVNLSLFLSSISIQTDLTVSSYIVLFLLGDHIGETKWKLWSNNIYSVKSVWVHWEMSVFFQALNKCCAPPSPLCSDIQQRNALKKRCFSSFTVGALMRFSTKSKFMSFCRILLLLYISAGRP